MAGQDNPVGGKESQEQAKESERHLLLLIPQNQQSNSHSIHRGPGEDPLRTGLDVSDYEPT